MSKRNFILLFIILIIAGVAMLGYFYFSKPTSTGTGGEDINFLAKFNPFGSSKPADPKNTGEEPIDISGEIPEDKPVEILSEKLKKISTVPVAGFEILTKERLKDVLVVTPDPTQTLPLAGDGKKNTKAKPTPPPTEQITATRYVDRASGNIYQTFLDKIEERKFSTTIIPKVYEAYFCNKNTSVLMRYLKSDNKTIETFLGAIPKEILGADTANNEIKGVFLSDGITDVSSSPDGSKIFYLVNVGDDAVGTILNLADSLPAQTGKKTQIFSSAFTEWLSSWPNSTTITLTTKPSAVAQGHMYALNTTTKSFTRVLGDIYGLTTLTSPNAKTVLYSDSGLSLNIYDIVKKTSKAVGLQTLPEKCVWGSASDFLYCAVPKNITSAQYPDSWYQGEISFADQIWKIDATTGVTTLVVDPASVRDGEEVDGIKLKLSADGKYLLFVNKKDSYLWKLDLN